MTRRTAALSLALGLLVLLVLLAALLPVPYVRFAPGPTFNTIGEVNGTEVISISGTPTHPTSGNLDLTTVSESGGPYGSLSVGDLLRGWRDPKVRILPREVVYPDTVDLSQVDAQNVTAFDDSQSAAIAASMHYLKRPVVSTVVVDDVGESSPAHVLVVPGDVIVSIAGEPVKERADVARIVHSKPIGTALPFVLLTQGKQHTVTVTSAPRPNDPKVPYVGIGAHTQYRATFPITFGLTDVGGPSAGMMFSLGIIDKLTTGKLNGGRHVAGTGTIDSSGAVGPIGGIAQKLAGARAAGAEFFLAPVKNCDEVVGHVPDGLTVVPVGTLAEAVTETEAWVAGKPVPSCPAG